MCGLPVTLEHAGARDGLRRGKSMGTGGVSKARRTRVKKIKKTARALGIKKAKKKARK